jgi:hypothetical protein
MRPALLLSMLALALAFAPTIHSKDAEATLLPAWMSGHWCSRDATSQGDEYWLPEAGGLMVGLSRTVSAGRKTQFEFLRIELIDGVPTYLAQPQGRTATAFKRSDNGDNWIRFENPAHDFPQRIEYRREGEALHAEIAGPGKDGEEFSIPFEFRRCAD